MRIYMGFRLNGACHVYSWNAGSPTRPVPLALRLDLWNHSPSGFEWGFEGSGPAQLALALSAHALGDGPRAVRVHQHVKRALVAGLGRNCWSVTADQVCACVRQQEDYLAAREAEEHGEQ